jgi:thiamine kinase-like enzyme
LQEAHYLDQRGWRRLGDVAISRAMADGSERSEQEAARRRAAALPVWRGAVKPEPVPGGMSNWNFRVRDRGDSYFVRIGGDAPEHQVFRVKEVAASRAAHAAGLAPELVYAEPGAAVFRWIDGRSLRLAEVADPARIPAIAALLRRCHREVGPRLRGPAPMFWVFHAIRDYAARLGDSEAMARLVAIASELEAAVQPVEIVFGHNDLMCGNLVDDGRRLWLIDWEYAGYNSPLFDLANLCSNNQVDEAGQELLLAAYFGAMPDSGLRHRFAAMTAASLLREAMWAMVAARHSRLPIDFGAYGNENIGRFERAYAAFRRRAP